MLKAFILIASFAYYANAAKFYTKDAGMLHLSEQKWEIQHVLNLTEYVETTQLLGECIEALNTVCENGTNPLCLYFEHATSNLNTEIQADTAKLKTLSRSKRFMFSIPLVVGVSIVALWAGTTLKNAAIKSIRDEIQENLHLIEQAANMSISSVNLIEQMIKDNDRNMRKFQIAINNNTRNLDSLTRFFNVINVISFTAQSHERMQIKLNDIYYGDINSRLFEIIDFDTFSKTMDMINERLKPNLTLPNIITMSRNKFIKTYTNYNSTQLTISVNLPIMRKRGFNMFEFIPLPIEENGKLYILDIPTTTYYQNGSRLLLLPEEKTRDTFCKTQDGTTICNSFLEDYNMNLSTCMYNLLKNESDVGCIYKEIPNQNYFIKITEKIFYVHLLNPIKMVVDCRGKVHALTVYGSCYVYLPSNECELHKYNEKTQYKGDRTFLDNQEQNVRYELNMFNTSDGYKKLSYLPLLDKYNLQFIESKAKATRIADEIHLQEKKINKTSTSFSTVIYDFLNNTIIQFLIFGITAILGTLAIKELLIKLLTECRK